LGDGRQHDDDAAWDAVEADALYDVLERKVAPEFYTRDPSGIPTAWVRRMRESMARLTPQFSADRAVREYAEQHYLPAAAAYRTRSADNAALGRESVRWQETVERAWASLHFGNVKCTTRGDQHAFEVEVHLQDLDPSAVRVELYADGAGSGPPVRVEMARVRPMAGSSGGSVYGGSAPAARSPASYTARLMPRREGVAVPLEVHSILWQR
jgi:starch phosphorylase